MFSWMLIFDPNWPFCKGYSPCMMADFQNRLISRIFGVFSNGFLHRTSLTWLKNRFVACFLEFEFLTQSDNFATATALAWWPIFKIVSFLEHLVFSQSFFAQNNSNMIKESFFACFFEFEFLTQSDYFAKAIAFAWWPIFKIVSFLEYLVFSQAVFCRKQL